MPPIPASETPKDDSSPSEPPLLLFKKSANETQFQTQTLASATTQEKPAPRRKAKGAFVPVFYDKALGWCVPVIAKQRDGRTCYDIGVRRRVKEGETYEQAMMAAAQEELLHVVDEYIDTDGPSSEEATIVENISTDKDGRTNEVIRACYYRCARMEGGDVVNPERASEAMASLQERFHTLAVIVTPMYDQLKAIYTLRNPQATDKQLEDALKVLIKWNKSSPSKLRVPTDKGTISLTPVDAGELGTLMELNRFIAKRRGGDTSCQGAFLNDVQFRVMLDKWGSIQRERLRKLQQSTQYEELPSIGAESVRYTFAPKQKARMTETLKDISQRLMLWAKAENQEQVLAAFKNFKIIFLAYKDCSGLLFKSLAYSYHTIKKYWEEKNPQEAFPLSIEQIADRIFGQDAREGHTTAKPATAIPSSPIKHKDLSRRALSRSDFVAEFQRHVDRYEGKQQDTDPSYNEIRDAINTICQQPCQSFDETIEASGLGRYTQMGQASKGLPPVAMIPLRELDQCLSYDPDIGVDEEEQRQVLQGLSDLLLQGPLQQLIHALYEPKFRQAVGLPLLEEAPLQRSQQCLSQKDLKARMQRLKQQSKRKPFSSRESRGRLVNLLKFLAEQGADHVIGMVKGLVK